MSRRFATVELEYQNLIDMPPVSSDDLHQRACSNDKTTIKHWFDTWLDNIRKNKAKYGSFADQSIGEFWGKNKYGVAIIAGAGPSLKGNASELKNRGNIPLVSCLHNFHYLEDLGCPADYYVSLDAGPVTIEEVSEGGQHSAEHYWDITKNRTLLAYIGTDPNLLDKWQGKICFYNSPVPDQTFIAELEKIEMFNTFLSSGGNVLGASLYFAKAILGCHGIIFIGADFSFGYPQLQDNDVVKHRFHSWDSKYDDKLGHYIKVTDIYGNKVKTWPSYYNFASWFNWVSINVPGVYINATEGGCLGAFPQGNLRSFQYLNLADALRIYNICDEVKESTLNPKTDCKKILF
jgi:hypothetical protein